MRLFNEIKGNKSIFKTKVSLIKEVYVGKPNKCMCGCSGHYFDDSKKIQRVFNKLKKASDEVEFERIDGSEGYIYSATIGKTYYVVYTVNFVLYGFPDRKV